MTSAIHVTVQCSTNRANKPAGTWSFFWFVFNIVVAKKFSTQRKRSSVGDIFEADRPPIDQPAKKTKREFMKPRDWHIWINWVVVIQIRKILKILIFFYYFGGYFPSYSLDKLWISANKIKQPFLSLEIHSDMNSKHQKPLLSLWIEVHSSVYNLYSQSALLRFNFFVHILCCYIICYLLVFRPKLPLFFNACSSKKISYLLELVRRIENKDLTIKVKLYTYLPVFLWSKINITVCIKA